MGFVCTLEIEDRIEFFERGSARVAVFPVGYDDQDDRSYQILVALEPRPGGGVEEFDYTFCLVEYDGETGAEHTYWSGKDVARFVPRPARALIMDMILAATRALLQSHRPRRVLRFTWERDPPEPAIRKRLLIARVFESCGYRVYPAESMHGDRAWWAERIEGPEVDRVRSEKRHG